MLGHKNLLDMQSDASVRHSEQHAAVADKTLLSLGFRGIFSNLVISSKSQNPKLEIEKMVAFNVARNRPDFAVLNRVTFVLQISETIEKLPLYEKIRNMPGIHCLAVRPSNEAQFLELLSTPDLFDLISLDLSTSRFFNQFGAVSKAVKSADNLLVEIELAPILNQPDALPVAIAQSRAAFGRVSCCLVSSGAHSVMQLRSPLDLANWGTGVLALRQCEKNAALLLDRALKKRMLETNYIS